MNVVMALQSESFVASTEGNSCRVDRKGVTTGLKSHLCYSYQLINKLLCWAYEESLQQD